MHGTWRWESRESEVGRPKKNSRSGQENQEVRSQKTEVGRKIVAVFSLSFQKKLQIPNSRHSELINRK